MSLRNIQAIHNRLSHYQGPQKAECLHLTHVETGTAPVVTTSIQGFGFSTLLTTQMAQRRQMLFSFLLKGWLREAELCTPQCDTAASGLNIIKHRTSMSLYILSWASHILFPCVTDIKLHYCRYIFVKSAERQCACVNFAVL